jgi:hypothetical protein
MIGHSKRLSVVKDPPVYDTKNVNSLQRGISIFHNASLPPMRLSQKVTFRQKLLFSVVLQRSHSTTDIVLTKDSTYLMDVSFLNLEAGRLLNEQLHYLYHW